MEAQSLPESNILGGPVSPTLTGSAFSSEPSVSPARGATPEAVFSALDSLQRRVTALEGEKERMMEFSFQSVTILLAILGVATGVPFALLYGSRISVADISYVLAAELLALVVILLLWISRWWNKNFTPRGEPPSIVGAGQTSGGEATASRATRSGDELKVPSSR